MRALSVRIPLGPRPLLHRLAAADSSAAGRHFGSPASQRCRSWRRPRAPPSCRDRRDRRDTGALAAKAATTAIPIVFAVPEDPLRLGLVASLARPCTNMTGINFFNARGAGKRLELLCALVPNTVGVAALVNPT